MVFLCINLIFNLEGSKSSITIMITVFCIVEDQKRNRQNLI